MRFFRRTRASIWQRIPLHPFELVALGMAVSALLFLRAHRLSYGWNTISYTFPPLVRALPRLFVLGVALRLLRLLLVRGSLTGYLRAILRPAPRPKRSY